MQNVYLWKMKSNRSRMLLVCLLGFFFTAATLEIDFLDYDNTFFDQYDSYVKVDSKAAQRILTVDWIAIECSECAFPTYTPIAYPVDAFDEPYLFGSPPRLFLLKSPLLI